MQAYKVSNSKKKSNCKKTMQSFKNQIPRHYSLENYNLINFNFQERHCFFEIQ